MDFLLPNRRPLLFLGALVLSWVFCCGTGWSGSDTEYSYRRAQANVERLFNDKAKQKYRHNWLSCIKGFRGVYSADPEGPRADDAVFMVGRLYGELYKHSFNANDREEAIDHYNRLLKRFPKSPYRSKAQKAIAELDAGKGYASRQNDREIVVKKGVVKKPPEAASEKGGNGTGAQGTIAEGLAEVTNLRVWSNPSYTRIVIDMEKEVPYSYRLLKKDPAIGKPQRLYVDLNSSRLGGSVQPVVTIGDDLLSDARAGQYTPDTVRVVVDIKSIDSFKIFSLQNPYRVVLDVNGVDRKAGSKAVVQGPETGVNAGSLKGSLAKQLALGVRRVVIDPGHGGKDPGAIGYDKKILEKNVTLEVAKRLAKKLREDLGLETVLTRERDEFLSLEERTAIANMKNGDLFISIHANANRNRRMRGIETYFLNLATDEEAILVAARENATSTKNISDLEAILNDLMKNAKINESSRLASHVQKAMTSNLKKKYSDVRDNGVKQAPFYVLLGAEMPCVLVETSFISHPKECERLNTAAYQEALADAIVGGVEAYVREINPTALTRSPRNLQAHK